MFEYSKSKITRAKGDISELEIKLSEYAQRKPYVLIPSVDSLTCSINLIFEEREKIPSEFSLIIGDAIHNLRSALDILVLDIFKFCGLEVDSRIGFPIAGSEDAFEKIIRRGKFSKLDRNVLELFRSFRSFKNSNVLLKGLHDLDIEDKHKRLLLAATHSDFQTLMQFILDGKGSTVSGSTAVGNLIRPGNGFTIIPAGDFDTTKEYDVKIQVVFSEPMFDGVLVTKILKDQCEAVEDVMRKCEEYFKNNQVKYKSENG